MWYWNVSQPKDRRLLSVSGDVDASCSSNLPMGQSWERRCRDLLELSHLSSRKISLPGLSAPQTSTNRGPCADIEWHTKTEFESLGIEGSL